MKAKEKYVEKNLLCQLVPSRATWNPEQSGFTCFEIPKLFPKENVIGEPFLGLSVNQARVYMMIMSEMFTKDVSRYIFAFSDLKKSLDGTQNMSDKEFFAYLHENIIGMAGIILHFEKEKTFEYASIFGHMASDTKAKVFEVSLNEEFIRISRIMGFDYFYSSLKIKRYLTLKTQYAQNLYAYFTTAFLGPCSGVYKDCAIEMRDLKKLMFSEDVNDEEFMKHIVDPTIKELNAVPGYKNLHLAEKLSPRFESDPNENRIYENPVYFSRA